MKQRKGQLTDVEAHAIREATRDVETARRQLARLIRDRARLFADAIDRGATAQAVADAAGITQPGVAKVVKMWRTEQAGRS